MIELSLALINGCSRQMLCIHQIYERIPMKVIDHRIISNIRERFVLLVDK